MMREVAVVAVAVVALVIRVLMVVVMMRVVVVVVMRVVVVVVVMRVVVVVMMSGDGRCEAVAHGQEVYPRVIMFLPRGVRQNTEVSISRT